MATNPFENFSKNVDFSIWGKPQTVHALSRKNETKIVKITHSALGKHIIMMKIHKLSTMHNIELPQGQHKSKVF